MPIYEYECGGCQQVFEVRQKFNDPPPAEHSCGSNKVKRILSNTSFVLKGTGWYKTDYAAAPKGDSKAEASGQKKDAPKSETAGAPGASTKEASKTASSSSDKASGGKSGGGGSEAA